MIKRDIHLLNDTLTFFYNKDYNRAITNSKKLLNKTQDTLTVYEILVSSYAKLDDFENSIFYAMKILEFEKNKKNLSVIEFDCEHIFLYSYLIFIYTKFQDSVRAESYKKKACDIYDSHYASLHGSIIRLEKIKDFTSSNILLNKAKEINKIILDITDNKGAVYSNLGGISYRMSEYKEALSNYLLAAEKSHITENSMLIMAAIYRDTNDFEKSHDTLNKLRKIHPDEDYYVFRAAELFLLQNDYKKGFKLNRTRYSQKNKHSNSTVTLPLDKLMTDKTNIQNKNILITPEQGYGDVLQFIRFIPFLVKKMPKSIQMVIPKPLRELFEYNFKDIDFINSAEEKDIDFHFPIADFGYLLGINSNNVPFSEGYLKVCPGDSEKFKELNFNNGKRKSIGISFKGNQEHFNDKHRSIELNQFIENIKPLMSIYDVYSLEYEVTNEQKQVLLNNNISTFDNIHSFYDTALAIDNLDCVLTVDTAIAHLSSAMSKKTFIFIPYSQDWRWGYKGEESIWYDNAQLLRQEEAHNWKPCFEKLVSML